MSIKETPQHVIVRVAAFLLTGFSRFLHQ